jgi:hypothetical protein
MVAEKGYDSFVRKLGTLLIALVVNGVVVLSFAGSSAAQGFSTVNPHGVPASVTSNFFGGHNDRAPGIPASVTSSGTIAPRRGMPGMGRPEGFTPGMAPAGGFHRHHPGHDHDHDNAGVIYYAVPYAVPYAMDYGEPPADSAVDEPEDYRGGPTIFDRRGSGSATYSQDPAPSAASADVAQNAPAEPPAPAAPERIPDLPQTVVVFKDGHQLEMANYAIVGDSLFDLTPGHRHKIPLADLDLPATERQNDDRGIDFRLPAGNSGN